MAQPFEVLYDALDIRVQAEHALVATLNTFQAISETDRKLANPIINRDLIGVSVALKLGEHTSPEDAILFIAQIGEIERPHPFETFLLKATSRAFEQRLRGAGTDTRPMEKLSWLSDNEIYKASSASVNGLHVGFAGGWAHHSRLLAISFAEDLAACLGLPEVPDENGQSLDDERARARLEWLNQGQDSGDNTPKAKLSQTKYSFIFDMLNS